MKRFIVGYLTLMLTVVFIQSQTTDEIEKLTKKSIIQNERHLSYFDKCQRVNCFPNYFGGSYIDENGKLVVLITKDSVVKKQIIARIIKSNDFVIKPADYSIKEIYAVMDTVDAFISNKDIPDSHPILQYFSGAYINVIDNCVVMQLSKLTPELVYIFKKEVTNSPIVKFRKYEMPTSLLPQCSQLP